jgi:hypothetical protein
MAGHPMPDHIKRELGIRVEDAEPQAPPVLRRKKHRPGYVGRGSR